MRVRWPGRRRFHSRNCELSAVGSPCALRAPEGPYSRRIHGTPPVRKFLMERHPCFSPSLRVYGGAAPTKAIVPCSYGPRYLCPPTARASATRKGVRQALLEKHSSVNKVRNTRFLSSGCLEIIDRSLPGRGLSTPREDISPSTGSCG